VTKGKYIFKGCNRLAFHFKPVISSKELTGNRKNRRIWKK
jgi:hypothetical protein